jgi:arginyl-tRNA synthetase
MQEIKEALASAVKSGFGQDTEPELTRPDEKFGDLATNAAMVVAKKAGKNPREVAILLAGKLHELKIVSDVQIADPGFINLHLSDDFLLESASSASKLSQPLSGQEILVEFGDPNPFKEMHIGHLYSAVAGDTIAGLLETAGAKVHRLSYHGDVGPHIAMALWAMKHAGRAIQSNLGLYYAKGAAAYEKDEKAQAEIREINKHLYAKDDMAVNALHDMGIKKSFEYFDQIFATLGIKYEKSGRYLESAAAERGLKMVRDNIGKVFEKSEGAVVYKGEKVGLHTRVFINSEGLPTYEAKDLGLVKLKAADYPKAEQSIIVTAHEQAEYFKVMLAALAEIDSELSSKTVHIYHGFVSPSSGKMSSRTGQVYPATKLLDSVKEAAHRQFPKSANLDELYIGAVKYALLKYRLGADIVFDVEESVSLQGNSGPYIQYAQARAQSILAKAGKGTESRAPGSDLEPGERSLARKISEYPEVVAKATEEFLPNHITAYLYELAQVFNSFYEKNRVIGDKRQAVRLQLTGNYADVLKSGLKLLNIAAPERV